FIFVFFFFSSRRRHTRCLSDWSSDVCSSDLGLLPDRDAASNCIEGNATNFGFYARPEFKRESPDAASQYRLGISELGERYLDRRSEERRVGKECRSRGRLDH